ncbi:hypothetical protein GCM10011415_24170 [Salipiger pallidus]|uniref:Uncharacterized protein n=1 Tax=Salipiger pallidus TaxID=1775170 RepID=A0A8J3EG94_9RHOB|nr:hypothetical protein GCM10011415_24170 [Salipiger pallidus]
MTGRPPRALFCLPGAHTQLLVGTRKSRARIALNVDGQLVAALFAGPEPLALKRDLLATLPGADASAA